MPTKPIRVVLTGVLGSGKGTQARILQQKYGLCHLSTGEILRREVDDKTKLGIEIADAMKSGNLVPDEMVLQMVSQRIDEADCKNGFILDGFPRNLPQAEAFDKILQQKKIELDAVIDIEVPQDLVYKRILGRFTCKKCGTSYNEEMHLPKVAGVCDVCGGTEFYKRLDDNEEVIRNRLSNYYEKTVLMLPFYERRGLLKVVDGALGVEKTSEAIEAILRV